MNINAKHDFILYNKDENKWNDRTLSPITLNKLNSPNVKSINSGMGYKLYSDQKSYLNSKAKTYQTEQKNRKIINNREHFHAALLESTSEVFKLLTKNQDKSLKEKQNIVKEISDLSKSLKAIKEEPKQEEVEEKKEEVNKIETEEQEEEEENKTEHKETLSKNECKNLINSDDNMDKLFGIKIYNDGVIRCRIYTNLKNNHLIENDIDHKIEFI